MSTVPCRIEGDVGSLSNFSPSNVGWYTGVHPSSESGAPGNKKRGDVATRRTTRRRGIFFTIASILYNADDLSQNVFWKFNNSDPYQALSFDRLHTFPGGLFRGHLWKYLQAYVEALGRAAAADINNMYVSYSFQFHRLTLTWA
jgi:hypothetical protein